MPAAEPASFPGVMAYSNIKLSPLTLQSGSRSKIKITALLKLVEGKEDIVCPIKFSESAHRLLVKDHKTRIEKLCTLFGWFGKLLKYNFVCLLL